MVTRRTVITAPLALAAAATPMVARAQRPDTVTLGLSLRPDSLDPTTTAAAAVGQVVHGNILEGLTKISENGAVHPLLAESWEASPDGRRYIFKLQKNVYFHDGRRLDSAVVKFALERSKAAREQNKLHETLFKNIVSIFTRDVYTIEIVFAHADPIIPFRLAESPAVILHPDTAGQAARHPVGTGPFRYASQQPDADIVLTRWPHFRFADQVRIQQVTFHFVGDPAQQFEAVTQGRIDVLFHISTHAVERFQQSQHYEVMFGSSGSKGLVAINNRRAPLNDVRVRRAITQAIDREAFVRDALDGRGRTIGSHFAPSDPGYINLTGLLPHDPYQAQQLLEQAGVHTPPELTLTLPPTPYALSGGPLIADALEQVGFRIRVERVTWAEWLNGVFKGDFDLSLILHAEPLDYAIYTRPDYYFGYDSPNFRTLVHKHQSSGNPREQRSLFRQIQRHLANDAVNAWVFTPEIGTVVRKGLKGVWMNYPVFFHDAAAMYWD